MLAVPFPDADQLRNIISPGEDAGEYCCVVIPLGGTSAHALARVNLIAGDYYPETRSRHPSRQ